jgi:DNA-binding MarR family transcriptional regulator
MKSLLLARPSAPTADETFRTLLRTLGSLERVMQPYFARHGISGAQWGVLRTLYRAEQAGDAGLRLVDLSERLLIRPPSVTGVVGRLERAGLLSRVTCVSDQRARLARLTSEGRRLVERILAGHAAQQERVVGVLSAEEQNDLHRLLTRLGNHCEKLTDSLPGSFS